MKRITTTTLGLLLVAAIATAGCQKRDDTLPAGAPGAGPGTTTTTPGDTGTPGSMGNSTGTTPMPPASAASQ